MDLAASMGVAAKDARSFDAGVYRPTFEDVILGGREPEVLRAGRLSANVLRILRVQPILGRDFRREEDADGAPPVALISERLWTEAIRRHRSMVGQTISVGSVQYTVVGILPDGISVSRSRHRRVVPEAGERGLRGCASTTPAAARSWALRACVRV